MANMKRESRNQSSTEDLQTLQNGQIAGLAKRFKSNVHETQPGFHRPGFSLTTLAGGKLPGPVHQSLRGQEGLGDEDHGHTS